MSIRWIHQQVSGEKTSIPMSSLHYQLFFFLRFYAAVQALYRDGDIVLRGPLREPMWRDTFERTWSHAGHDLRNRTNDQ